MAESRAKTPLNLFEPHYSTIIFRGYLKVLLKRHSRNDLDACFRSRLGVGLEYLLNQGNWLSESGSELFYDCVDQLEPGNLELDEEAGRKSLSAKDLGVFTQFVSTFLSLDTLVTSALRAQRKINKVDELLILERTKKSVTLRVRSSRKTNHLPRIARNWSGFLSEFPKLFGLPGGRTRIRMLDAESFEIALRWGAALIPTAPGLLHSNPRNRIRWTVAAGLISLRICMIKGAALWGAPLALGILVLIYLELQALQRKHLEHNNLEQLISSAEERYSALFHSKREVEELYSKARVLSSVATKVVEAETAEEVILLATARLHDELGYGRALFFLKNEETGTLDLLVGQGIPESLRDPARMLRFSVEDDTGNPEHIVNIFKSGRARLVRITPRYLEGLSPVSRGFIESLEIREFFALPVATPEKKLGVLFVTSDQPSVRFDEKNVETLATVANHLAISIDKSMKLEEEMRLRALFESYVSAEVIKESGSGKGKQFVRTGSAVIAFFDLRGFTRLMNSAHSPMDSGLEIVQGFYETVTDAIYARGGIVNKFLGDGALAVFEVKNPEDASRVAASAIAAALEIQEAASKRTRGKLNVSAGMHLGPVMFATVGKVPKLEFTVLGDAVNLSSRLCTLSKDHQNQLIISESMRSLVETHHIVSDLGGFQIKGIEETLTLYSIREAA